MSTPPAYMHRERITFRQSLGFVYQDHAFANVRASYTLQREGHALPGFGTRDPCPNEYIISKPTRRQKSVMRPTTPEHNSPFALY